MLTLPSSVRVYVATRPFDLRKSFDGLAAAVISEFGRDPISGHLHVFWNKRGHLVRVIFWDRTGYVVVSKRLARGRFAFVQQLVSEEPCVEMDAMELSLILEGIDLSEAKRRKRWRPPRKSGLTPCAQDPEWIDEKPRGSRGSSLSLARRRHRRGAQQAGAVGSRAALRRSHRDDARPGGPRSRR